MLSYDLEEQVNLETVNNVLAAIGESPVDTLEDSFNVDIENIVRLLKKYSLEVQASDDIYIKEEGVELKPDAVTKKIPFRWTYLRLLTPDSETKYRNVNGYIYDKDEKTNLFDEPITVDLVRYREFTELPYPFRAVIEAKAAKAFNNQFFGNNDVVQQLSEDLYNAQVNLVDWQLEVGNLNMLDGDAWTSGQLSR